MELPTELGKKESGSFPILPLPHLSLGPTQACPPMLGSKWGAGSIQDVASGVKDGHSRNSTAPVFLEPYYSPIKTWCLIFLLINLAVLQLACN